MRYLARLTAAGLSPDQLLGLFAILLQSPVAGRRAIDVLLSSHSPLPQWAVLVLANADLLVQIIGGLERCDSQAPLVSHAWNDAWNQTAAQRRWLRAKPSSETPDSFLDNAVQYYQGCDSFCFHPVVDWCLSADVSTLQFSCCGAGFLDADRGYVTEFNYSELIITATIIIGPRIYVALTNASGWPSWGLAGIPAIRSSSIRCYNIGETYAEVIHTLRVAPYDTFAASYPPEAVSDQVPHILNDHPTYGHGHTLEAAIELSGHTLELCTYLADGGRGYLYATNDTTTSTQDVATGTEILRFTIPNLQLVQTFGVDLFPDVHAQGMAVSELELFVGDPKNHAIQIFVLGGAETLTHWTRQIKGSWTSPRDLFYRDERLYLVDGHALFTEQNDTLPQDSFDEGLHLLPIRRGTSVKVLDDDGNLLQVWSPPKAMESNGLTYDDVTEVTMMGFRTVTSSCQLIVQTYQPCRKFLTKQRSHVQHRIYSLLGV